MAFFSDSLSERNGAGAYYHDLLAQLPSDRITVEMFQPLPRKKFALPSLPMPGDPMQRLYTPNVFRIGRSYRQFKPDIVVVVTPGPFGLLGLYFAMRHGARFLTAFHTDFEKLAKIYWSPVVRAFCGFFLRSINRFLCKRSAAVLINNSDLRGDVESLGAPAVEVMGTPLPPDFIENPPPPAPETIGRICFVGRLAAEKNVDWIVAAAARFPDIHFDIGGDGPLRASLEASAADLPNVRFLGWLSRDAVRDLIDESGLLLLPSKLETFGSVALEAMARGRPALVSANAGIHDWPGLRDGLFALSSGESLEDAITRLRELSPKSLRETGEAARKGAERLNRATLRQWREVLERYAPGAESAEK